MFQSLRYRHIAASKDPIIVGPWRSEVGFESLYWLPWLAKWMTRYQIDPSRIVAVSRGGAGAWYPAGQSVELYDYVPVASVRRAMLADSALTGTVKQFHLTALEQKILPAMATDLGLRRYHVLHPREMYRALAPWFDGRTGLAECVDQLQFGPFQVPHAPLNIPLPEKFIAVGFYARHTWMLDEERRDWADSLVEGLAKILPVVIIESGLHADDHVPFPAQANVLSTAPYCTPENNLAVQSSVLAKAQAFVGTYGGLMQLAVRLRKPSVGFYTQFTGTSYGHKTLTEWLGMQQQTPVFIGRPEDAKFVQEAMQVTFVPPPSKRGSSRAKVNAI